MHGSSVADCVISLFALLSIHGLLSSLSLVSWRSLRDDVPDLDLDYSETFDYFSFKLSPPPKARGIRTPERAARSLSTWPTPRTPHASHGRRIKSWVRIVSGSTGKLARDRSPNPTTRSAKKMTIRFGARGNLREVSRTNLEAQGLSTTILKSQILCTLRKSWRPSDKSWIVRRTTKCLTWTPMYWSENCLCRQRRKP